MNLIQEFKEAVSIKWTNDTGAAVASGDVVNVSPFMLGIVYDSIAADASGTVVIRGRARMDKDATLTISPLDLLYWDATNEQVTNRASGLPIGLAATTQASTDTEVDVDLNVPGMLEQDTRVKFFDDFLGSYGSLINATGTWAGTVTSVWETVDVGDATEAVVADVSGGAVALTIAATSEAEDAVLYFGDQLNFDIDQLQFMEMRAKVTEPGTGVTVVFGMAGNHNLDKDTVAQNAWFRCEATLAMVCETDDGTHDEDDVAAMTLVTATYYQFLIDFRDTAALKFYVKTEDAKTWTQVATAGTFNMASYTGNLQPYFSCDKASGTGTGALTIDYVRIIAER